jgi:lambda family phage portal protein
MAKAAPRRRANLLDRAIEFAAPVWGAKRAAARMMLDQARGYAAAKAGRRTDGWIAGGTSANAEIGAQAGLLRARARQLVRDNGYAAHAIRQLSAKTVGAGIVPRLAVDAAEIERKQAARATWDAFSDNCDPAGRTDFYGLQALVARTMFESGECLIRFLPRPASWKMRVPLQLDLLEPDYLDSAKTRALENGGWIVQGVEYDQYGRRVAYWLFDEHPGDTGFSSLRGSFVARRVPAGDVLHVFNPLRPRQARGVSAFAASAMRLRDLEDYADAELMRKKIAACFAAFVKSDKGAARSPLGGAGATEKDGDRTIERLSPGAINYLQQGEDVTFATPGEAGGYVEYMRQELRAIAAGVGVTYEQLTGDLSQTNYSSMRGGKIDFWDVLDQLQHHVFVPQLCRPAWNRVFALEAALGRRDPSVEYRAIWTPPRRRWVDPAKEVAAARDEVRSGFVSLRAKIAETGEDPDEVISEIAADNKRLDAAGIVLDSDPRKIARGGSAQSVAADSGADDSEDDDVPPPAEETETDRLVGRALANFLGRAQ